MAHACAVMASVDDAKLWGECDGMPLGYAGTAKIPDAAVVTLNGIIASAAATEIPQLVTGFADDGAPNCGWIYDGLAGVTERIQQTYHGCAACRFRHALTPEDLPLGSEVFEAAGSVIRHATYRLSSHFPWTII
jgi:hypothetical protein